MRTTILATFSLLAAVSGCSDATKPPDLTGTYVLSSVWGEGGPPFLVTEIVCENGQGTGIDVVYDSLIFTAENQVQWSKSESLRMRNADGVWGPGLDGGFSRPGSHRREGSRVILTYEAIPQFSLRHLVDTLDIEGPKLSKTFPVRLLQSCGDSTDYRGGKYEYTRQ